MMDLADCAYASPAHETPSSERRANAALQPLFVGLRRPLGKLLRLSYLQAGLRQLSRGLRRDEADASMNPLVVEVASPSSRRCRSAISSTGSVGRTWSE